MHDAQPVLAAAAGPALPDVAPALDSSSLPSMIDNDRVEVEGEDSVGSSTVQQTRGRDAAAVSSGRSPSPPRRATEPRPAKRRKVCLYLFALFHFVCACADHITAADQVLHRAGVFGRRAPRDPPDGRTLARV